MTKRGQAALEFLSTYGFAFLIILVMIGALTYFGILSPGKFIPGSCLISPEFKCKDRAINSSANSLMIDAKIQIINQLGNQVDLVGNATSAWTAVATGFSTAAYCYTPQTSLVGGATTTITCNLNGSFPAKGEKLRVAIDFQYKELGGAFNHPVRAEVVETIQ